MEKKCWLYLWQSSPTSHITQPWETGTLNPDALTVMPNAYIHTLTPRVTSVWNRLIAFQHFSDVLPPLTWRAFHLMGWGSLLIYKRMRHILIQLTILKLVLRKMVTLLGFFDFWKIKFIIQSTFRSFNFNWVAYIQKFNYFANHFIFI